MRKKWERFGCHDDWHCDRPWYHAIIFICPLKRREFLVPDLARWRALSLLHCSKIGDDGSIIRGVDLVFVQATKP